MLLQVPERYGNNMNENMDNKQPERYREERIGLKIVLAAIVILLLIVIDGCYAVTYENEYTLIKQFGKVEKIVSEAGISFKLPFIQSTDKLPKSLQVYDLAASDVITEDKKTMVADSYVLWKIEDPKAFCTDIELVTECRISYQYDGL